VIERRTCTGSMEYTVPFYIRDMSICRLQYSWDLEPIPLGSQGMTTLWLYLPSIVNAFTLLKIKLHQWSWFREAAFPNASEDCTGLVNTD
jgi:hypothetical protein